MMTKRPVSILTSADARILDAVPHPTRDFIIKYTDAALSLWSDTTSIAFEPNVVRAVHGLHGSFPDPSSTLLIPEYLKAVKILELAHEPNSIKALTSEKVVDRIKDDRPRLGLGYNDQFVEYLLILARGATP